MTRKENMMKSLTGMIRRRLARDYRTLSSVAAFNGIFEDLPENPFCLSIGGGPKREHVLLTNLNIQAHPNVDVVGDAHALPFVNDSVDAIHCEAVLEHLSNPPQAVREMHRVLKPRRKAYVCTPFLQAYHGYPNHYQNYTLLGHQTLFRDNGFYIVDSGTCVGPMNTMVTLGSRFISEYFGGIVRYPVRAVWLLIGMLLKPIDRVINRRDTSHILASTTYVLVEKRERGCE